MRSFIFTIASPRSLPCVTVLFAKTARDLTVTSGPCHWASWEQGIDSQTSIMHKERMNGKECHVIWNGVCVCVEYILQKGLVLETDIRS